MGGFQKPTPYHHETTVYPSPLFSDNYQNPEGEGCNICLFLAITVQLMHLEGASANGKTLKTDPPTFLCKKKVVVRRNSRPSDRHALRM